MTEKTYEPQIIQMKKEYCIKNEAQEVIDHPEHYQGNGLEVIDVIESFSLNFRLGNAIKYILRAGKKGERSEDLKKAIWYIEREIKKS